MTKENERVIFDLRKRVAELESALKNIISANLQLHPEMRDSALYAACLEAEKLIR